MATLAEAVDGYFARAARAESSQPERPILDDVKWTEALQLLLSYAVSACPHRHSALSTEAPWLDELVASGNYKVELDRHSLMFKGGLLPDDHLFKSMARQGTVRDNRVLFNPGTSCLMNAYALGANVCGHKGIVHGGLSAAMIDESFGYLTHLCRRDRAGGVPETGTLLTAHLEVDYKLPLPAGGVVVCICEVEKVEGRKVWATARLMDTPDGKVYAVGKALFIAAKQPPVMQGVQ